MQMRRLIIVLIMYAAGIVAVSLIAQTAAADTTEEQRAAFQRALRFLGEHLSDRFLGLGLLWAGHLRLP